MKGELAKDDLEDKMMEPKSNQSASPATAMTIASAVLKSAVVAEKKIQKL